MTLISALTEFYQECANYTGLITVDTEHNPEFFQRLRHAGMATNNGTSFEISGHFTACSFNMPKVYGTCALLALVIAGVAVKVWNCKQQSQQEEVHVD